MKMPRIIPALLSAGLLLNAAGVAVVGANSTGTTPSGQAVGATSGPPTSSAIPTVLPAAEKASEAGEDSRRVCRQRDTMGTRLRAVRVCRTIAEWRTHDNAGRKRGKELTEQRSDGLRDPAMGGG